MSPPVVELMTSCLQEPQGGLTGYLKSWVGGGSKDPVPHGDQKLTHTSDFSDGSKAAVSTAPDSSTGVGLSLDALVEVQRYHLWKNSILFLSLNCAASCG